ncbi:unnamed protein product [Blepharisma stoltei]|uniref:Uncharacterized protein n=1 Tax=Blepharisma stoltei TaxID=1481888 RepID=A0AAU9K378_9CILI|nr:unnamed protein product [Blepharisma stoltei]
MEQEDFSNGKGKEILIMHIELGNLGKEKLIIHENDVPDEIVHEFAAKFNLDEKIEKRLSEQIAIQIGLLVEEHEKAAELVSAKANSAAVKPVYERIQAANKLKKVSNTNIGEILYNKGLEFMDQLEEENEKKRQYEEEKEKKELTFMPKISEFPSNNKRRHRHLAEYLYEKERLRLLKIDQEKELQYAIEQRECTFTPTVNPMSKQILNRSRPASEDKFTDLYNEAYDLKKKREVLAKQYLKKVCTFRPNIISNNSSNCEDVVERLLLSKKYVEERLDYERKIMELPIDRDTGLELFKPSIGRPPAIERNRNDIPIGDFLYRLKRKSPQPQEFPHQPIEMDSKARSNKILQKAKIERYFDIYQQLSPDSQGEITYENINVENIEKDVYKIIKPFLEELQSINQKLSFGEFCESMDNLCKLLCNTDKNIITIKKKPIIEENKSLKKKSLSMTSFEGADMYERQLEIRQITQAKLEYQKQQNYDNEVEGCTFRPRITAYRPNQFN